MKKFILLLVVSLTLLPLLKPGLFDVHDPTSLIRFFTLDHALRDGQFPAAWTNELNQGYGYPLFLYYAPVFSYLGVLLKLVTPSYLLALKLAISFLVITSSWGMYKLMRRFVGSHSALVSAIAYTLLPYHAATLYVRGSYAEGVTWSLLPWLLYLWSAPERDKYWAIITSVITALFLLSHNTLPLAFLPFLFFWLLIFKPVKIKSSLLALSLSLGLSLWFFLPVLFERNFIQLDGVALSTRFSDHFLTPSQLWHSPWGYGGSAQLGEVDGMSFMLGKFQLVLALISLFAVVWSKKWDPKILFFLSILIFYSFMTTTISAPIWGSIGALSMLQFPWRLLAFASFGLAALTGYFVEFVSRSLRPIAMLLAVSCLLIFNLKFFTPQRYLDYADHDFVSDTKLATVAKDKIPEYLPYWMQDFPTDSSVDGLTRSPTSVSGKMNLSSPATLLIKTAYMPQWQLTLNGSPAPIEPSRAGLIQTVDQVTTPDNTIELTWHRTNLEQIGLWILAVSLLCVVGLLLL